MPSITITCTTNQTLSYKEVRDFQKSLKTRTTQEIQHLKESIVEHGFSFPLFIWQHTENGKIIYDCLDGHGRLQALAELENEGYSVPELPVVFINASTKKEAREVLICANTVVGAFNATGVQDFVRDLREVDFSKYALPGIDTNKVVRQLEQIRSMEEYVQSMQLAEGDKNVKTPTIVKQGTVLSIPADQKQVSKAVKNSGSNVSVLPTTPPPSIITCSHCGQTFPRS